MKNSKKIFIIGCVATIVLSLCLIGLIPLSYIAFFRPVQIVGNSMNPTLKNGQYYIIKLNTNVTNSDLVVYQDTVSSTQSVGRIVATSGNTFEIREGYVYIDGKKLEESYLKEGTYTAGSGKLKDDTAYTLGDSEYIILGDNRENSYDSRNRGVVKGEEIVGKIWICYYMCE